MNFEFKQKLLIGELEDHVSQLTAEVAAASETKQQLLAENQEEKDVNRNLLKKLEEIQTRCGTGIY